MSWSTGCQFDCIVVVGRMFQHPKLRHTWAMQLDIILGPVLCNGCHFFPVHSNASKIYIISYFISFVSFISHIHFGFTRNSSLNNYKMLDSWQQQVVFLTSAVILCFLTGSHLLFQIIASLLCSADSHACMSLRYDITT